jgi:mRNA interferase MazF
MDINRGDIVIVNLDPTQGSEQGKTRPAVIIQNDVGNEHAPTTILAPITSSYDKIYPVNVELKSNNTPLDKDSVALLNQIRTVSIKHRIVEKIGEIPEEKTEEIDKAIEASLGLRN